MSRRQYKPGSGSGRLSYYEALKLRQHHAKWERVIATRRLVLLSQMGLMRRALARVAWLVTDPRSYKLVNWKKAA